MVTLPRMTQSSTPIHRRGLAKIGAVLSIGAITGCLGDDRPDDVDDTDDADELADDGDDTDDADVGDTDDVDDAPEEQMVEIVDATLYTQAESDHPGDVQFHPYGDGPTPTWAWEPRLLERSDVSDQIQPSLIADWSYEPGVIEITFDDDFYWWSGDRVTVEDFIAMVEFEDFLWGGDELDHHENIVSLEQTDDDTARLALPDAWREDWALEVLFAKSPISSSRMYYRDRLEEFEDAADLDAVEDIRDDIEGSRHETDDELVLHHYIPFEVRLDENGYGQVGDDFWELEFVPEKNGNLRHYANLQNSDRLANFRYIRFPVAEDRGPIMEENFMEERTAHVSGSDIGADTVLELHDDLPFDTVLDGLEEGPVNSGGWNINHAVHPGDNVHFRRAWAYLNNFTVWTRDPSHGEVHYFHPFLTDNVLHQFASEELIDNLTDYGWDEHRWDDAETEMETGGFERNADGDWMLQDDGLDAEAGEPMDFEMRTHSFTSWLSEFSMPDFQSDLEEFGIQTDWFVGNGTWDPGDEYVLAPQYTGGIMPELTFERIYVEGGGGGMNHNVPSTVEAPEFLETSAAGDTTDDWVEYDVRTMTDRLPVTIEETEYQELVDQLTWVCNQAVNHFNIGPRTRIILLNDNTWSPAPLEEYPEKWYETEWRVVYTGAYQYVGD